MFSCSVAAVAAANNADVLVSYTLRNGDSSCVTAVKVGKLRSSAAAVSGVTVNVLRAKGKCWCCANSAVAVFVMFFVFVLCSAVARDF